MQTVHSHDAVIPALGFGTFELSGNQARDRVRDALDVGYRHIDTARAYRNEEQVGEGLRTASVPRDQVFLTTKIWPDDFRPDDLERALERSVAALDVDHVDLTLLHWPNPDIPVAETLGGLERARERGLTRHYGVSNFTVALFEEAWEAAPRPLVTNQVEYHPFLDQRKVHAAVRRHGAALTAYCPLAQGRVVEEPVIEQIAAEHNATAAQVALAWLLARDGVVAIPRSSKRTRVEENFRALGLELTAGEQEAIARLRERHERLIEPGLAPEWDAPGAPE